MHIYFDGHGSENMLAALSKGDRVTVIGQLDQLSPFRLEHAEIVDIGGNGAL
jgi:hypothetical protein